ncbi:MAG: RNA methyltransferase [Limnochordia bacterium]|nr:RNA methyltransferase [Limnochordia bacterium]
MDRITSRQNRVVKSTRLLRTRKGRLKEEKVLLEGVRLVSDALLAGNLQFYWALGTETFWTDSEYEQLSGQLQERCPCYVVSDDLLKDIADTQHPQGIVSVVGAFDHDLTCCLDANPLILVADQVADPGNAGTLVRTAAAAAASGVIFTRGSVDLFNPKCLRASMGAVFRVPVCREVFPEQLVGFLRKNGVRLYGAAGQADLDYTQADFSNGMALAVGSEAFGLSPALEEAIEERLAIPMANGVESLNVGVAAGVLLYEAHRQRYCKA